jgi:hypothetical protein
VLAIILTALSFRKSSRYRPGQPWEHDSVWVGGEPAASGAGDSGPTATAPGSGGASGKW